jgi:hypothetical protein
MELVSCKDVETFNEGLAFTRASSLTSTYIVYTDGWKYQLKEPYSLFTGIFPAKTIYTPYICLTTEGLLTVKEGYAWDGPSGPAIDSDNFMRGSLVHDVFYQLIRENHLPLEIRDSADRLLQKLCIEDGMTRVRAYWVYKALSWFGGSAASKSGIHKTLRSPKKSKK